MTDTKHETKKATSTHTPGPWEHDGTGLVYGQPEDETGGSTFVCDVVQDGQREWMDDTEKANARLIAASPKLLEALDYLLEQTVDQDLKYGITLSEGEEDARRMALATIAEAKGLSL